MRKSSKLALLAALILAILVGGYFLLSQQELSDREQILETMEMARSQASDQNVSAVMDIVSKQYIDSEGLKKEKLRFLLSQAFRGSDKNIVDLTPPTIAVDGDRATARTRVKIHSPGDTTSSLFNQDVTLVWHREEARKWLVMPVKIWRIVSADYKAPTVF